MKNTTKVAARKPLMVFAGNFRPASTESGLAEGFLRSGWAVQKVDVRKHRVTSSDSLMRAISRVTGRRSTQAFHEELINECEFLRPDVVFFVKGIAASNDLLERIRDVGAKLVVYYPDVSFNHPGVLSDLFRLYDLFVTTKSFQVSWLREHLGADKVAYVPHGYTDGVHEPIYSHLRDQDRTCDVLYSGNYSDYKRSWLQGLLDKDESVNLQVIGRNWRDKLKIDGDNFFDEVTGVGYSRAIQLARINVALHFGPTDSVWQDLVSRRTFEIPACKGFMLHIDNDEVRDLYDVGREIDVFSSIEELHEKIVFYLQRPGVREKMIERAYARCVPSYGHVERAAQIHQRILERGLLL